VVQVSQLNPEQNQRLGFDGEKDMSVPRERSKPVGQNSSDSRHPIPQRRIIRPRWFCEEAAEIIAGGMHCVRQPERALPDYG